jgi:hypothetical protein
MSKLVCEINNYDIVDEDTTTEIIIEKEIKKVKIIEIISKVMTANCVYAKKKSKVKLLP